VREVLTELGGEIKLWRIAMRPGAPVGSACSAASRGSDSPEIR